MKNLQVDVDGQNSNLVNLRWKDGIALKPDLKYWCHFDGLQADLTINNVQPNDAGWYKCRATSSQGSTETSALLTVNQAEVKANRKTLFDYE